MVDTYIKTAITQTVNTNPLGFQVRISTMIGVSGGKTG
jgi:hypothetical protein